MVKKAVSGQQSAVTITTPLKKKVILDLKVGDMALISGQIVTGRERIHKFLFDEKPLRDRIPFNLEGSMLYHCGPIIKKTEENYKMVAAGPSASIRFEIYTPWIIREYGIKAILGKGGMGKKTKDALRENGSIYLQTISAATILADKVKRVMGGWKIEEFGISEAMWLLEVEDFPAIVTMDAQGNSLHDEVEKISLKNLNRLLRQPRISDIKGERKGRQQ